MEENNQIAIHAAFQSGKVEVVYGHYYRELVVFARHYLGSTNEFLAEDCVQNAIFEAWKRKNSFVDAPSLKSFLFVSIRNQAISILRKQNSREKYAAGLEEQTEFLNQIIEAETFAELFRAIETLPEIHRRIFELTYFENLKIKEIASILDLSEITIKKNKAKALESLRNKLSDDALFLLFAYFSKNI